MLFLGLRVGEVLALRWPDIDPDKRRLTVSHNLLHLNGTLTLRPSLVLKDKLPPLRTRRTGNDPKDTATSPTKKG